MVIAKKPDRSTTNTQPADPEKAAEAFIAGAGGAPEQAVVRKTPVMIRFDRELLDRVDVAAKRRGISRSAWVQYTISRALDTGEG
jgi:predicted HicB family RNase H-like nuclease